MYIKEYEEVFNIPSEIFDRYNMNAIAYFDIETTGFDKDNDTIILISLGWYDENNSFHVKQYYAENISDEKAILEEFKKDIIHFTSWCSYNGIAFDEPFIKIRMDKNNIAFTAPSKHIDLYRKIRPYYKQLGLPRCNLKTVEKHLGIHRQDQIDGGISVQLYSEYLITGQEELRRVIMLHNYEDVLNLPLIFKMIYEIDNNCNIVREDHITDKQLKYLQALLSKNKITLDLELKKISKKSAARTIDRILKGNATADELSQIIKNSY
ncbi:MAG: ribonuclease H-like domain-containing protein [Bacillota bacterium]|nr:ribonuclease H-like domain-containing protein [Bacillota bacterium]